MRHLRKSLGGKIEIIGHLSEPPEIFKEKCILPDDNPTINEVLGDFNRGLFLIGHDDSAFFDYMIHYFCGEHIEPQGRDILNKPGILEEKYNNLKIIGHYGSNFFDPKNSEAWVKIGLKKDELIAIYSCANKPEELGFEKRVIDDIGSLLGEDRVVLKDMVDLKPVELLTLKPYELKLEFENPISLASNLIGILTHTLQVPYENILNEGNISLLAYYHDGKSTQKIEVNDAKNPNDYQNFYGKGIDNFIFTVEGGYTSKAIDDILRCFGFIEKEKESRYSDTKKIILNTNS